MLYGFKGLQPQIGGQFGCGVPVKAFFMLCVVSMVTTIVVGIDLGMHDICQKFYCSYLFLS
jgi:hypothetical protein